MVFQDVSLETRFGIMVYAINVESHMVVHVASQSPG